METRTKEERLADKIDMELHRLIAAAEDGRDATRRWRQEWSDVIANLRAARLVRRMMHKDDQAAT